MTARDRELALRERLGIPTDARRILVFAESSHWDTNWLQTSEEYFEKRLTPIFNHILRVLESDPKRVYSIESVFFLKLFWERNPAARERLAKLLQNRQLRIMSSSFTTPDTLLPHQEAVLRDFHLGQEWLRANGIDVIPRTAYFPDNFGHSPHLPTLMRAVGVDSVAVTRIDGMYFIASDYRSRHAFPLKGSTAELLQKELRTLDFVWRADDGSEILSHWNAFTYFQGDMLAHVGIVRWNGHCVGIPWRTRGHIARRVDSFVRQLDPLSRTPYMLCPIGMDFNDPIEDLRSLLDRYNQERYGTTGTWTVLAGLDDYFELIEGHREKLPVLSVDPNPYWMGFYSSRPALKQRPTRIARSLVLAENLAAHAPPDPVVTERLRDGWMNLVLINHHDAITGTSPDRIWNDEQKLWLDAAEAAADNALDLLADSLPEGNHSPEVGGHGGLHWWHENGEVRVHTEHGRFTFSEAQGGCLTSMLVDGEELLSGFGLDLVAFADHGGLWRLGHEFRGGRFDEVARASGKPATIQLHESADGLTVVIDSVLRGRAFQRRVTFQAHEPYFRVKVTGEAPRRVTVTCRIDLTECPALLEMDTVGGHIERPPERLYKPTFWPVPSFVTIRGEARAVHAAFEAPTAVSFSAPDSLEWIVARNAPKERAFGILPVLAHPIGGTVDEEQSHEAAIFVTPRDVSNLELRRRIERSWLPQEHARLRAHADALLRCSDPSVTISATKKAEQGDGIIVRLTREHHGDQVVQLWLDTNDICGAARCDAREHDLEPLQVEQGRAQVRLTSRLTSVRIVPQA